MCTWKYVCENVCVRVWIGWKERTEGTRSDSVRDSTYFGCRVGVETFDGAPSPTSPTGWEGHVRGREGRGSVTGRQRVRTWGETPYPPTLPYSSPSLSGRGFGTRLSPPGHYRSGRRIGNWGPSVVSPSETHPGGGTDRLPPDRTTGPDTPRTFGKGRSDPDVRRIRQMARVPLSVVRGLGGQCHPTKYGVKG